MKWTETIPVRNYEADANGYVSPAGQLRIMEEGGNRQIMVQHPNWQELDERGQAFLLAAIRIYFYEPVRAYDELTVNTWASDSALLSFNRCYEIRKGDTVCAQLNSTWAMVNLADRSLLKVKDVELSYDSDAPLDLPKPTQVRLPRTLQFEEVGTHRVRFSETDYIRHMNNTRYLDLLCDWIPDITHTRVTSIGIKFRKEAPLDEVLTITRCREGNTWYFRTYRSDGQVNVDAEIETEPLA